MTSMVVYSWEKKKKTLLRNIKPGDIFCFALGDVYHFGRIMTRNRLGHVAEIFEETSNSPALPELNFEKRIGRPVILDSYGLFDRKIEGDWRIVARQEAYQPRSDEAIHFTLGMKGDCKKVDIFDNEEAITESEAKKLPDYSPMGEYDVIEELGL